MLRSRSVGRAQESSQTAINVSVSGPEGDSRGSCEFLGRHITQTIAQRAHRARLTTGLRRLEADLAELDTVFADDPRRRRGPRRLA